MTFNESNVNLSEEYLDIRTTLRMNKDFMHFMRTHYPHIAVQQFGLTTVEDQVRTAAGATPKAM